MTSTYQGLLGEDYTNAVINATGPGASARNRQVMGSLIRHLHDFARENQITVDEWTAAVDMVNWAGQMSNSRRNESQLVCDVLGLESLVDDITYTQTAGTDAAATNTAILGPFYRADVPPTPNNASIVRTMPADGESVFMHGRVTRADTGAPLAGVSVDVWQCSTNGLYEQQDPAQAEFNFRGKLTTDAEGYYGLYCIRPVPYPVPYDGPAGKILQMLDRQPFRPAHIHIFAVREGFATLTTQIFDRQSQYLTDDSVFAVKDDLVVDFRTLQGDAKAGLELEYDIKLAPRTAA